MWLLLWHNFNDLFLRTLTLEQIIQEKQSKENQGEIITDSTALIVYD